MTEDMDQVLAWKQALIFFVGVILTTMGIVVILVLSTLNSIPRMVIGIIMNIIGLCMLGFNLYRTIKNKQIKAVKIMLLVPKIILFCFLLGLSFFMTLAIILIRFSSALINFVTSCASETVPAMVTAISGAIS